MRKADLLDFDYLHSALLAETVPPALEKALGRKKGLRLLDLGSLDSPYERVLREHGVLVRFDVAVGKKTDAVGSGERLPFRDNAFDGVVCTQVLEHVKHPFEVAEEIRRVLKAKGKVVLTTHGLWHHHPTPRDRWRFTHEGLQELFAGFVRVKVTPQGGSFTALMQLFNCWVKGWHCPWGVPVGLWWHARRPLYLLPNVLGRLLGFRQREDWHLVQNYLVEAEK